MKRKDFEIRLMIAALSLFVLSFIFMALKATLINTAGGEIAQYYLKTSLSKIESANVVNAILWEFRGYDTLGEELVLIASSLGVFAILFRRRS